MHSPVAGELVDGGDGNLGVAVDARPARGVAQRAVGLVNGFVTTEFNDGSMSGQLGDDRSERVSGVGAGSEVEKPLSSRRLKVSSVAADGSLGRIASESEPCAGVSA